MIGFGVGGGGGLSMRIFFEMASATLAAVGGSMRAAPPRIRHAPVTGASLERAKKPAPMARKPSRERCSFLVIAV